MTNDLLPAIRQRHPDANEREAEALHWLIAIHQHLPPNLLHLSTGRFTVDEINAWIDRTYGFKIVYDRGESEDVPPQADR